MVLILNLLTYGIVKGWEKNKTKSGLEKRPKNVSRAL
jgi:hypothetical protein